MPCSLAYEDAITAASGIKDILAKSGLASLKVTFVESVVKCSVVISPKLLLFNPHHDNAKFLKPFTPTLGISITLLKTPYYGGMGVLYLHLHSNEDHVTMLTCAHVACPPPAFPNNIGIMHTNISQACEHFVMLSDGGYSRGIRDMIYKISNLCCNINIWNSEINRLLKPTKGENPDITNEHKKYMVLVEGVMENINKLNALHSEVMKYYSTPKLHVFGHVLHTSPIQVSVQPHSYTKDWGLILVDCV